MKELNGLQEGLLNSSSLLIKRIRDGIECSFWKEGFSSHVVVIRDEVLAAELARAGVMGILEGADFLGFRSTFKGFALRVKARKLYRELSASQPPADAATPMMARSAA